MSIEFTKHYSGQMFRTNAPSVLCDITVCDLVKVCFEELKNDAKIFTINWTNGDSEDCFESLFEKTETEESLVSLFY